MTKPNHMILVVDDDEDLREVICGVLEDAGYEAASAGNGREALDFLRSSPPPCLVLLDLMMPVMDRALVHRREGSRFRAGEHSGGRNHRSRGKQTALDCSSPRFAQTIEDRKPGREGAGVLLAGLKSRAGPP